MRTTHRQEHPIENNLTRTGKRRMYSLRRVIKAMVWLIAGSPGQKQRVRHELARVSAGLFGDFYIGEDFKSWRQDQDFIKTCRTLSPHNFYSEERKFTLREFIRFTASTPGSIAECGCYEGASAWFLAHEAPETEVYLFDSFEGLSTPDNSDLTGNTIPQWQKGDLKTTEDNLKTNLGHFKNIRILKGWIPNRFDEVTDCKFRLVHIDVDLYQPTLDSLAFFYPRLSSGGVIVMDDYGFLTCPGSYKAVVEYMSDKPEYVLHLPTGQGIIIRH